MRLLSFLTLVETQLSARQPLAPSGWERRVNYQEGRAVCWHPEFDGNLQITACELSGGRHSLNTHWRHSSGQILSEQNFFCLKPEDWETAAAQVVEAYPVAAAAPQSEAVPAPLATRDPQSAIA